MGFLGKIVKGIGKAVGGIAKGIAKFAQSPFGKLLMNVGLSMVTGGVGGLLGKGLSMLGGAGGILGKAGSLFGGSGGLGGLFGGFAKNFLGKATDLLSKSGLGGLAGFVNKAANSGDLLSIAKDLLAARKQAPQADATTEQIANQNIMMMLAHRQARQLTA